ncbi:hypothetical protein SPBR_02637 [Sporothrix brasiliensis 5110]|uniref:Rhodopsin domain-containing protein n=1 Tax=Sporothrix brasiliensis 5110 TaxID=1398154 RepID=A0A0C2J6P7_9PEZI|nr:uncharacterized protein SPBR_02637 [Sporothrix brasiliensis 5110]KIH92687.1 hypothetical protein SPBR_02637 [Sporothrix brasiliensis 5110]
MPNTTDMASALRVPDGPTSGLQDFAIAINFIFPSAALLVVAARVVGRATSRQFGTDDWLISIAMIFSLIQTAISYMFIKTNFVGIHFNDIPPHDPIQGAIWNFAVEFLYNPILSLAKSSVLIFLLRLFGQKTGIRRFIIVLNTINLMQMIGVFVALIFQCTPIAFNWDKTIKGGHCVDQRLLFVSTSAFNILTDIIVLGLPLYILADLKIRRRTKFGLIFIFLLGILVTITSIARMVIFVQGLFGLVVSPDPTFNIGFMTSDIETNLALITASIPALRPFLRARDRGGWLPRFGRAPNTTANNTTEMARNTAATAAYLSRASTMTAATMATKTATIQKSSSRRGRDANGKLLRIGTTSERQQPMELRSQSPRSSEEEAMTSNGIMRVSDIQREIDGLARELTAVSGPYSSSRYTHFLDTDPAADNLQGAPQPPRSSSAPGFGRRRFADQYYSEGADPDVEYARERDFNEERLSRYGERRFGVITPKGVPPQWPGHFENGGRKEGQPF